MLRRLGHLIDCPLVIASANHNDLRSLRPTGLVCAGIGCEQRDREGVAPRFQLSSARDFVGRIVPRREENLQAIFRAVLFRDVGQHQQTGFVVLVLPGLQKAIGSGQGGSVFGVGSWEGRRVFVPGGDGCGQPRRQGKNYQWEGKMPSRQPGRRRRYQFKIHSWIMREAANYSNHY
jgi:hypothetical protein